MKIDEIKWRDYCCGDACQYSEVTTAKGTLQIKTSHDADDISYLVRRYGVDNMPIDAGYLPMSEMELAAALDAS